jgi:hypothetical protein
MFEIFQLFNSKISSFKLNQSLKKRYKVYLDHDMVFYDINYKQLNANLVYNEAEFYDYKKEGLPAFLRLQILDSEDYIYFPNFNASRLEDDEEYAVLTYKFHQTLSTKSISTVWCLELSDIEVMKKKPWSLADLIKKGH